MYLVKIFFKSGNVIEAWVKSIKVTKRDSEILSMEYKEVSIALGGIQVLHINVDEVEAVIIVDEKDEAV